MSGDDGLGDAIHFRCLESEKLGLEWAAEQESKVRSAKGQPRVKPGALAREIVVAGLAARGWTPERAAEYAAPRERATAKAPATKGRARRS